MTKEPEGSTTRDTATTSLRKPTRGWRSERMTRDVGSRDDDCSDDGNGNNNGDGGNNADSSDKDRLGFILCGTVFYGTAPKTIFAVYTSKVP